MASKPLLVNGIPGTGKSTLAKKLAADLKLPLIHKDDIKEFFYDALATNSREESQLIGRVAFESLYVLIEQYVESEKDLMVECPFFVSFARPKLKAIISEKGVEVLEVYCVLPEPIRQQRIRQRLTEGRHPQHVAGDTSFDKNEMELAEQYAPLQLGKFIEVSTERFGETEYQGLLDVIRQNLDQ